MVVCLRGVRTCVRACVRACVHARASGCLSECRSVWLLGGCGAVR